jgi:hypothetical protein
MPKKKSNLNKIFPKETAKILKKVVKKPKKPIKKVVKKTKKPVKKVVKKRKDILNVSAGPKYSYIQKINRDIIGQDLYKRSGADTIELKKAGININVLKYDDNENYRENSILNFANKKSFNMLRSGKYNDYKLSVVIEYEDGTYSASRFMNVGQDLEIWRDYSYNPMQASKIKSFSIKIKNN